MKPLKKTVASEKENVTMESHSCHQTKPSQVERILLILLYLLFVTEAVRDGGEVRVVETVLPLEPSDVERAVVMFPATGVDADEAIEVIVVAGQVFIATPLGPRHHQELIENPPLLPTPHQNNQTSSNLIQKNIRGVFKATKPVFNFFFKHKKGKKVGLSLKRPSQALTLTSRPAIDLF